MGRELRVTIVGDPSSLQRALRNASSSADGFGRTMKSAGKAALIGLGVVGGAAVVAGTKMVSLASDAAEVDSKMKVVFGKELPGLKKNLDAFAQATGASRFELREQAADMGALLEPLTANKKGAADMSAQFVKLATDLGSFNNVPTDEALLAIRSGLVGEAEPLRRFGVLLNAAAVESEGLRLGLVKQGEEMTEQQKVQARASLIMQQTTLAQGDAERTAGSMANQMKALRNNITDAATSMGTLLIPFALQAVQAFNENWPTIERIVRAVLLAVIGAITGVVAAVQYLRRQWEIHRDSAILTWNAVRNAVLGVISWFQANVVPAVRNVVAAIRAIWERFGADIMTVLRTSFGMIITMVGTFIQNMLAPFKIFLAVLRGDWSAAWGELKGVVTRTWNAVESLLRGYVTTVLTIAKSIGKAIIDGIVSGVTGIVDKIREKLSWLWNWLRTEGVELAKEAAVAVGKAIYNGILDGLKSLFTSDALDQEVARVIDSAAAGTDAFGKGKGVGFDFGDGILAGLAAKNAEIIVQAAQMALNAVASMQSAIRSSSPSKETEEKVGKPLADGILLGFLNGTAELPPKISERLRAAIDAGVAAVQAQQSKLSSAFQRLSGDAMRAFDAATDAGLAAIQNKLTSRLGQIARQLSASLAQIEGVRQQATPAEMALQAMEEGLAAEQRAKAFADAQAALAKAQAEGDAAAIAAAQEQLYSAQNEITMAALRKQAEAERAEADKKAAALAAAAEKEAENKTKRAEREAGNRSREYQAERDLRRRHLEDYLAMVEEELAKEPKKWTRRHRELMAKFKAEFGPDFKTAGENLGAAFAEGLENSMDAMGSAAQKLARLIAQYLKTASPTEKGPMSTLHRWWEGFVPALASGLDTRALTSTISSATTPGPAFGGGGATIVVPVYLNRREIARVMTDEQRALREGGYPMPRP